MKLKYLFLSLILIWGLTSCSSDDDNPPTNLPATSANISGSVNLYDEGTTQIDNSGMTVSVDGSSITATTNAAGEYTLQNVPFGNVTLIYEKTGYGTFKKFNINHNNGDTFITENPSLGQMSTTTITDLNASVNGGDVSVSATTDPAGSNGNTRYIRYFLSEDANVSDDNYSFHSQTLISRINPYQLILSQDELINAGFLTGQTVYIKVYGESFWGNEYNEPNSSTTVFPNLNSNSATAVSFVVP